MKIYNIFIRLVPGMDINNEIVSSEVFLSL